MRYHIAQRFLRVSYRRVGGIRFLRICRVNISFSVSRTVKES